MAGIEVLVVGRSGAARRPLVDRRDEYEAVRDDARRFAIVPGHEIAEVADVVEQHEDYAFIQKRAETWEIVERTDPRRPLE